MAGIVADRVSSGVEVAVAERSDDPALRALLRESVIPGSISLSLTREPDYFASDGLAGAEDVTVVARDGERVVGMGRMSVTTLLRNGEPRRIAYLGGLRVAHDVRESPRLMRRGYDLLLECAPAFDGCFTSITSDNARARHVLENGGMFGLPTYRRLCELVTLVAPVRASAREGETGAPASVMKVQLNQNLALTWDDHCWTALEPHGVTRDDFVVVRERGEIVGTGAVWDQRRFRQTVVNGYSASLERIRPLLSGLNRLLRQPSLPAPGSVLASGAMLGAAVTDSRHWPALWNALQARASARGLTWLVMSRDARDPELSVLRRLTRAREYHTTLYEVTWRNGPRWPDPWDDRLFRPEVGLL